MSRPMIAFVLCLCTSLAHGSGSAVQLDGLSAAVELTRDRNGIVHVQAKNEADLWFMQGYVHARDRLLQMDAGIVPPTIAPRINGGLRASPAGADTPAGGGHSGPSTLITASPDPDRTTMMCDAAAVGLLSRWTAPGAT